MQRGDRLSYDRCWELWETWQSGNRKDVAAEALAADAWSVAFLTDILVSNGSEVDRRTWLALLEEGKRTE